MHYVQFIQKIEKIEIKIHGIKRKIKIAHLSDTKMKYPYSQFTESRLTKIYEITKVVTKSK